MIKLVASDLDGTLLSGKLTIPDDFFDVLHRMKNKGIAMVAASGRDFNGATQFFGDRAKELIFICDNGANIYNDGVLVETHNLDREKIHNILKVLDNIENADPMLCGAHGTYISKKSSPAFIKKMSNHYSPVVWVDNLYDIDDSIFKVSVYDVTGDIRNHTFNPLADMLNESATIHISSEVWVDIMDKSANKGIALKQIQHQLGISYDETMAFGDFYNDEPLLKQAKYAFVMENGKEDLKKKYPYHAKSNNDSGVTKAIREWIFNEKE